MYAGCKAVSSSLDCLL